MIRNGNQSQSNEFAYADQSVPLRLIELMDGCRARLALGDLCHVTWRGCEGHMPKILGYYEVTRRLLGGY
jgi:hypothetical protein